MNFDPNDPRITTHALGEPLDAEAEAFVRTHQDDPLFQAAVAEIQATATLLQTAFAAEPATGEPLDEASILANAQAPEPSSAKSPNRFKLFVFSAPAIAAVLVLMGLAGFAGWWFQRTPDFTATATIQVHQPELGSNMLVGENDFQAQLDIARSVTLAQAAAERMSADEKSRFLNNTLKEPWVQATAADEILKRTMITPNREAYAFTISVQHPDPNLAAKVANYLADEYINYNVKLNIETSMRAVEDLRIRADLQREKVQQLREELSNLTPAVAGSMSSREVELREALAVNSQLYQAMMGRLQTEMAHVALTGPSARILGNASPTDVSDRSAPTEARGFQAEPVDFSRHSVDFFGIKDSPESRLPEMVAPSAQELPSNSVYIHGHVIKPGPISLPDNATLTDAIRIAGINRMTPSQTRLTRTTPGGKKLVMHIDLNEIAANPASDVVLQDGDVIALPEGILGPSGGPLNENAVRFLQKEPFNREGYDRIEENAFTAPKIVPLSTFSIDVDTASYANVRRMLRSWHRPPPDAVRIEELINYFSYDYPVPDKGGHPFSVTTELAPAPWQSQHYLVRIGLKGYEIPWEERPPSNLVFLVDVSGSMEDANKLGLVKQALGELTQRFDRRDRVAIVVYAGSSGLALPSTTADNQETIQHALNNLQAGGSTNGGQGIELAYAVAQEQFIAGGNNRVILCTDGDFNVGVSDRGQLTRLIEDKAKSGVFLSICGFGMGNYQDDMMEALSNKGNGNYAYIDDLREARKVFGSDLAGTMLTIAKDVKIQVEFNPANVAAYRLIGYENRKLAAQDFNDDQKDAGEIGAGHTVTALYEIIPVGVDSPTLPGAGVDPLKYQTARDNSALQSKLADEWVTVKLRYKQPDGDASTLMTTVVNGPDGHQPSADFQFATAVAEFGMLLRNSEHAGNANWPAVIERARQSLGNDEGGHRSEFVELAKAAQSLSSGEDQK